MGLSAAINSNNNYLGRGVRPSVPHPTQYRIRSAVTTPAAIIRHGPVTRTTPIRAAKFGAAQSRAKQSSPNV